MDKNGQKYTSNLQMSVFAITDDRKALRSIFRIFILYAGQHSCMRKLQYMIATHDDIDSLKYASRHMLATCETLEKLEILEEEYS